LSGLAGCLESILVHTLDLEEDSESWCLFEGE